MANRDSSDRPSERREQPRAVSVSVEWGEEARRARNPRAGVRRAAALLATALALGAAVVLADSSATNHRGAPRATSSIRGIPSSCLHSTTPRVFVGARPPFTTVDMQVPFCP